VVLELVPLDAAGQPVDDVTIQTIFGSSGEGMLVLPGTTHDFLGFSGAGLADVRDVRATFTSVRRLAGDTAALEEVETTVRLLGPPGSSKALEDLSEARRIRITYPVPFPIVLSLGYQVLEPRRGPHGAQNALALVVLADRVSIPAGGATVTADITEEGIAALRRWGDADRYQDLMPFLPLGQPFLTYLDE
jgi:hypothetical protein